MVDFYQSGKLSCINIKKYAIILQMKLIFQTLIMLILLTLSSIALSASAEKVFEIASQSIVVVKVFDSNNTPIALGSGVVVGKDKIITNCHVAEAKPNIQLQVEYKDKVYAADLIGQINEYDLCLIQTNNLNVPIVTIKHASELKVGQRVYAIGTPRGFELTLTDGLISSLRNFNGESKIIQTSAAISPGSSGGGLFDDKGALIGITTFKVKDTEGVNFAHLAEHVIGLLQMSEQIKQKPISDLGAPKLMFVSDKEGQVWLREMSERLKKRLPDQTYREDFLRSVHYEATRAGLDPQLVLSLIQVVSGFRKLAVSPKGNGYMRINKKWIKNIGSPEHNLFQLKINLRYGCTILRHYIDVENGDLYKALNRYNESPPKDPQLPNEVLGAWRKHWDY